MIEYVTAEERMAQLEKDGNWGLMAELSQVAQMFPDVRLFKGHGGQVKYCTPSVNSFADQIETTNWCHDCDGAPFKVYVFTEVIDIELDENEEVQETRQGPRIYTDPPLFVVADQNPNGFGEIPRKDWQDQFEVAKMSKDVVRKIRQYLAGHPPIDYKDVED